ncbi:probable glutamate receptor, partial [Portunus trituberculatus]|uniref:probable glutamate receptor n=1 Tax=Portunus trituberculatus TaxID=210409 RepID=UPI001E1CB560
LQRVEAVQAPRGVAVFRAAANDLSDNNTHTHLQETVDQIRQVGGAWHCLVVVVVSDDPAFLAAFAHLSHRRHALRWSTRILVLTRLPLSHLGGLHFLLSNRNAMLLRIQDHKSSRSVSQVGVFVWQPYSSRSRRVATWTPGRKLTLASHESLFPDKFSVFRSAPHLKVVVEVLAGHAVSWVEDADALGGRRLEYTGYMGDVVKYFAAAMNFTSRYVLSPERTFGTKLPDGSWTGMIGMVVREEADFSPGPFTFSHVRYEAIDYTYPLHHASVKILSGLSGLETDPWGFLLPLTPLVWIASLVVLLGVLAALQVFSFCVPNSTHKTLCYDSWSANTFSPARVLLQQDVVWPAQWWWWERLVHGLWMLTVLVLAKSYAGNLMSLLAVRYVPQPFQTLRDVLDHPSVTMIWQKLSSYEQLVRDATFGEMREVAGLEKKGRLEFHTQTRYMVSLDTLVREKSHVLVDAEDSVRKLIALDFTEKGRCDFYVSRDGLFPSSFGMVTQKTSPLAIGFNKRALGLTEQGLFRHGTENVPNYTECDNIPKKKLVMSSISVSNIWGVFVLLGGGVVAGLAVWCLEMFMKPCKEH